MAALFPPVFQVPLSKPRGRALLDQCATLMGKKWVKAALANLTTGAYRLHIQRKKVTDAAQRMGVVKARIRLCVRVRIAYQAVCTSEERVSGCVYE